MANKINIKVFVDGEETPFLEEIQESWLLHWASFYAGTGTLTFGFFDESAVIFSSSHAHI